jgi:acetyl-CoA carboxylase biotin carboxylase subunit
MRRALAEFLLEGIKCTIPFHSRLLNDPRFVEGAYSTTVLESNL